ncbi:MULTISPECIES: hypothetical protein [Streptomyces]|uniref:Uncharacterized protein n=1 Tax=Streptomyces caviscabies TaxID=90079 RepID=A0ABW2MC14_9ACTN
MSHEGHTWEATWWTQGQQPSACESGVWKDLGAR